MNWEYVELTVPTARLAALVQRMQLLGSLGWEAVALTGADPTIGTNVYTVILRRAYQPFAPAPGEGWHPDPAKRHELRFFDGEGRWTEHVSDGGAQATDFPTRQAVAVSDW